MSVKKERKKGRNAGGDEKRMPIEPHDLCLIVSPGPKYQLKTVVGYKNHCISKYRNPAYTFGGKRHFFFEELDGPGPKYMIEKRKHKGFTFGYALKRPEIFLGPGPKYKLPDVPQGPFFSMKWRTKKKKSDETPGPYYVKPIADAPAFFMGRVLMTKPIIDNAGFHPSYNPEVVKPRAPKYTMAGRHEIQMISKSPGPIYAFPPPKPIPAFSFGIRHSKCAPPYITECDKQC